MPCRGLVLLSAAAVVSPVAGQVVQVTEATWDTEVTKRVEKGQFVLGKFYAPWCGHCKKLAPDWEKLGEKFNYKTNAHIIDIDCTADDAKKLCETYGVQGFPTLKYFGPGLASDGEKYEEDREYNALQKFVKSKSKKPCDPATLENCNKKDKAYLDEIKDMDEAVLKEQMDKFDQEIGELSAEQKKEADLFETQKDEAMATMKRSEDAKAKLSKLQSKVGYKLLILKAKTQATAKAEL